MALWLGNDRQFIYKPRGFSSIEEMNEAIVERHNKIVKPEDHVYLLGDLVLGDSLRNIEFVKRLNGSLHLVRGNHDTDTRWDIYRTHLNNIVEMNNAIYLDYKKYHFYLSHYPTITSNNDYDKPLRQRLLNICGHSHTEDMWQDWDKGYIYHCEIDAHNYPVLLDDIIFSFQEKIKELPPKTEAEKMVEIYEYTQNMCNKCIWYHMPCAGPRLVNDVASCATGQTYKSNSSYLIS